VGLAYHHLVFRKPGEEQFPAWSGIHLVFDGKSACEFRKLVAPEQVGAQGCLYFEAVNVPASGHGWNFDFHNLAES
jgi:hypothetical protein